MNDEDVEEFVKKLMTPGPYQDQKVRETLDRLDQERLEQYAKERRMIHRSFATLIFITSIILVWVA